ncbi:hypothetical protein [Hydrogenimonas sp.]
MDERLQEARERFKTLAKGKYYPARLTPEEAKKRLRESDPGLDISPFLGARDTAEMKRAGLLMLVEAANPQTLSYFSPLLVEAVDGVLKLLSETERKER